MEWLTVFQNIDSFSTGGIQSEVGSPTGLETMSRMHGPIPTELGAMTHLSLLMLNGNNLTGNLPSELGLMTTLELITFRDMQLTGMIPSEIGLLTGAKVLLASNNRLSGPIPNELRHLTRLNMLGLSDNLLTGTISEELSALVGPSFHTLDLTGNTGLSGVIPDGLCSIQGTCVGTPLNLCPELQGFLFDCSSTLCGCGCYCNNTVRHE